MREGEEVRESEELSNQGSVRISSSNTTHALGGRTLTPTADSPVSGS